MKEKNRVFSPNNKWAGTIAQYFVKSCEVALYCNLSDNTLQVLQDEGLIASGELVGKTLQMDENIRLYGKKYVHPDEVQSVTERLSSFYLSENLRYRENVSFNFRALLEGKEQMLKCIAIRGEDEKHAVIFFRNITEEFARELERVEIENSHRKLEEEFAENKERERLRDQLINRMLGDDGLFLIDCKKNTRSTLHDNCHGAENYSDEECYTASIFKYVETFVAAEDREMMHRATSPEYMLVRSKEEDEYTVEYRDISTGTQLFYEMRVAHFSDTEVLQGFTEKNTEIVDRLIADKLEGEYLALAVADLDAGMIRTIKNASRHKSHKVGEVIPYTEGLLAFADELEEEPREFFRNLSDINRARRRFETGDHLTYSFRSDRNGEKQWIEVMSFVLLRHEDGTPAMFTIGFSLADSLGADRHEVQRRMKEDMLMIGGLASGYHALYYFDMDAGTFGIYSIDGKRANELKPIVNENEDPIEVFRRFALSDLVHPNDRHIFEEINVDSVRERLAHTKKFSVRFRRNMDGNYVWCEMDVVKNEDANERPNLLVVGFAVRDQEIRDEIEQRRQLEDAKMVAEEASRSKTRFLFNMSHDIRTPMNAIMGFAEMAKKRSDDKEKVDEYLDKIVLSGKQLLTLINQVLEMSRIESGKIEFVIEPIDIVEKFNSMVTVLSEQADDSGLDFHSSIDSVKHCMIMADKARIASVALNIAGNAMKYTPQGGRVDFILAELPSEKEDTVRLSFTVKDTGIGMSSEFVKVLFEPFSRENSTTVSKIQGTGLGMAIVKNLVDLMGGTIKVESEPGKGTRFDVVIDFKIAESVEKKAPVKENRKASFRGHRVLLVEDNEMNREIAKYILSENGLRVDTAQDGDVAVGKIRKLAKKKDFEHYDCILMDVQMPTMNGYEATKAIREILDPLGVHIPIIAMTANAFEDDRRDAIEAGMDDHLAKPIDIDKCFETLAKYMRKKDESAKAEKE